MYRPFLLLLGLASLAAAQETLIRQTFDPKTDTHVEVLALFNRPSPGGFFPVRVKIANQLAGAHSVRLEFGAGVGYGQTSTSSEFTFAAPAGRTVTHDILVPLGPPPVNYGTRIRVSTQLRGSLGSAENEIDAEYGTDQPAVLLSEALFTPNASALDAAVATSGRYSSGSQDFGGKFDPKQLPDNWLAFSGYDSLLMLDSDWTNVPPGARNAILSWVRLGGQLVVYTSTSADAKSLGLPEDASFGQIDIRPIPATLALDPADAIQQVTARNGPDPRQLSLRQDFSSSWPLQDLFGRRDFRYGIFIIVLILFGVLVGPVNLFVFAKSGKRHKLFITTPLISLGASILLIALIILQDGFGGTGIRRVLMEVRPDASQNAAFIHQEQFSRTGVLTGSRFTIDPAAALTPVPIDSSRWARYTTSHGENRGTFDLQPADGKLLASGDWFQSRSEHGHTLTSVIPTRGRIERTAESNTYLSTFEFPIETLFYLDESNQWHRADDITSGKPFVTTPLDLTMAKPALDQQALGFTKRHRTFFNKARNRPGHFVAITTHAPAIETNPGIRWNETRTLITGPLHNP